MENKKEKNFFIRYSPTMLSLLAMCFGISAIRYSYESSFYISVILLLLACFIDGIDGKVSRALGVSSSFGVEIDSLADLVNFGVAPGFIIYFWKISEFENITLSWFPVLFLACCMAVRLARFNSDLSVKDQNDSLVKYFFRGMPAPAAAAMIIFPLVLTFAFGNGFYSTPIFVLINTLVIALYAGSVIPTLCFKKIEFSNLYNKLLKLLSLLLIIFICYSPWRGLSILGLIYVIILVISIFVYIKLNNNKKKI
jgi:CDP-diacylglycerol--serine O-phosphatidyltransferase